MRLDRRSPVPLYHQIAEVIRWEVATGTRKPGDRLPATRDAGPRWGVNRHTVRRAYLELAAGGLIQGRGPDGMRVTGHRERRPADPDPEAFVERCVLEARARFGLDGDALARRVRACAARSERGRSVTVIECSDAQCADLARAVEAGWDVRAAPFRLDAQGGGEPPPGPLLGTLFHYEEIRRRWPLRAGDTRFVSMGVHPSVAHELGRRLDAGARRVTLVAAIDRAGAECLAADLADLLGRRAPRIEVRLLEEWSERPDIRRRTVVATPHAWDGMPPRLRADVLRLSYAPDRHDLDAAAAAFGWSRRAGAPAPGARPSAVHEDARIPVSIGDPAE